MTATQPVTMFGAILRQHRERRRLSQADLAALAGFDHSYPSRLESQIRRPSRDAIIKLSTALRLSDDERDELLRAAGFASNDPVDPAMAVVAEALAILADATIPLAVRLRLRSDIAACVATARGGAV